MFYEENEKQDMLSEVNVLTDAELKIEVVELMGPKVRLAVPCRCDLPLLVLHLKDLEKFASIEITTVDNEKRLRRFEISSKVC